MPMDFDVIRDRTERILMDFVAARSDTNSPCEHNVDTFFSAWAQNVPYLSQNPDHWGLFPIPDDHLGRNVAWCMLRGTGADTLVFIHHCDCVETADYGPLEPLSLNPTELQKALRAGRVDLPEDAREDLMSDQWIFGRGVCDMKGGGSVQLALFEQYSRQADFAGSIVVISVPDEENLSAGMRGACYLLQQLAQRHGLTYRMMINCEPHQREDPQVGSLYDGSIGKLLPMVYVRGKLAHVGLVFDGLNPAGLLAEIIRRTELNPFFIERVGNTTSPACTWLYARDQKTVYDVSLPLSAVGCLSVLPLSLSPMAIMDKLREECTLAYEEYLERMGRSRAIFLQASGLPPAPMPWRPRVLDFSQLYAEALEDGGPAFEAAFDAAYAKARQGFRDKSLSTIEAAALLVETALGHVRDLSPTVVLALAPPYYPSVNNSMLDAATAGFARQAIDRLVDYGKSLGVAYEVQNYFAQISDLSYAMFKAEPENIDYIARNMLLWGQLYSIPLDIIRQLSMPVCNIGPWGKDPHRYTERVSRRDLLDITPRMVDFMVRQVLAGGA